MPVFMDEVHLQRKTCFLILLSLRLQVIGILKVKQVIAGSGRQLLAVPPENGGSCRVCLNYPVFGVGNDNAIQVMLKLNLVAVSDLVVLLQRS